MTIALQLPGASLVARALKSHKNPRPPAPEPPGGNALWWSGFAFPLFFSLRRSLFIFSARLKHTFDPRSLLCLNFSQRLLNFDVISVDLVCPSFSAFDAKNALISLLCVYLLYFCMQNKVYMKALWSPLVSQVSGSCGSLVASSNRYGSYLRNRNGPPASGSPYWQTIKDNTASLMASWALLSYEQKNTWSVASSYHLRSYAFGKASTLPGYNYYLSVNGNRLLCSLSVLDLPPVYGVSEMADNVSLLYNINTQFLQLSYNNSLSNDYFTKVYISDPVPAGITFFTNRLRLLLTVQSNLLGAYDISSAYAARFPACFSDKDQIVIKLVNFNSVSCAVSQPFVQRFAIAA